MENEKTQDGQKNRKDQSAQSDTGGPSITDTGEQQKDTQVDSEAQHYMTPTPQKVWTVPVIMQLVFDFVIMGATLTYAVFAIKQWNTMDGQLQQMKGSSKQTDQLICLYQKQLTELQKQVRDTDKLAGAAEKQAIASHAIAMLTEQEVTLQSGVAAAALHAAVMDFQNLTLRHWKDNRNTKQILLSVNLQNVGERKAQSISVAMNLAFRPPPIQRRFTHFDFLNDTDPKGSVWAGSRTITISKREYATYEKSDSVKVYVWREIHYDIFGVKARPVTFCRYALAKNVLAAPKNDKGDYDYTNPLTDCGQPGVSLTQ